MALPWYDALRERGWAVIENVYSNEECEQMRALVDDVWRSSGSPVPYDPGEVMLGQGISLSSAGFVCRELLLHAPSVARFLDREAVLDVVDTVLGPESLIESVAGNLNDETRPFCYWHHHAGGIHAGYFRARAQYPEPQGAITRLVCVVYLDGLSNVNGEMLVWPRKPEDSASPPFDDFGKTSWEGQDVVHCGDGSLVLLDELTWHAVRPQARLGRRRYIGFYALIPGHPTTSFAVPALACSAERSDRWKNKVRGASGAPAPLDAVAPASPLPGITLRKSAIRRDEMLLFDVEVQGREATIEVRPFVPDRPSFARAGELGVAYRGKHESGPPCASAVARALEQLGLSFDELSNLLDAKAS